MVLLDTCALIWLVSGSAELSANAREVIKFNQDRLFVSAISAFEIALLVNKKRLLLPHKTFRWYNESLKEWNLRELPVSGEIAITAVTLPKLHSDPADRIIVATARINKATLLTPDRVIASYSGISVVW